MSWITPSLGGVAPLGGCVAGISGADASAGSVAVTVGYWFRNE